MRTICFLALVLLSTTLVGQNADSIKRKTDSLNTLKEKYLVSLKEINKQLDDLNRLVIKITDPDIKFKRYVTNSESPMIQSPSVLAKEMTKIPKEELLESSGQEGNYIKVVYMGMVGYIHHGYVDDYDKYLTLRQELKVELVKKYGTTIGQKILDKKIWLGMTRAMAGDSWGKPDSVNKTVGSFGVHEQWVYPSAYLYFENGKLASWQTIQTQ